VDLGPYAGFILAAYGVAALVVAALVAWVVIDHAAQRRVLRDLEARGVSRRSDERKAAS
jgi:heme exporter protein D